MDVFDAVLDGSRGFLRDAAVLAGHDLGLFDALRGGARDADAIARALDVAPRRLRALLDVLVLEGAIARSEGDRFGCASAPPVPTGIPREGWGRIAEVIRRDRPLPLDAPQGYHEHLISVGAEAAGELWSSFPRARALIDAGGGVGAYTRAFLDGDPARRATLVDLPEVIAIASRSLAPRFGARVSLVAGDLLACELPRDQDVALVSNVLHLHAPRECARIVARVAEALAPGGTFVVKDLRMDADRRGPAAGILFALNMALYTDGGDVYPTDRLRAWMRDAGLAEPEPLALAASPHAVVLSARKESP